MFYTQFHKNIALLVQSLHRRNSFVGTDRGYNNYVTFLFEVMMKQQLKHSVLPFGPAEQALNCNTKSKSIKHNLCYKCAFQARREAYCACKYFIEFNRLYLLNILFWIFHFAFLLFLKICHLQRKHCQDKSVTFKLGLKIHCHLYFGITFWFGFPFIISQGSLSS